MTLRDALRRDSLERQQEKFRVRGVREFVLRKDDPTQFATRYWTYDMLCGKLLPAQLRYIWDADEWIAPKYAVLGSAALIAAGACIAHRRKKRSQA